jgi:vitamin B12 transporter
MKRRFFVVAAMIIGSQLHAQDSTGLLDEVVMTANKYPRKQGETGKVITVIGRQQLERSGGKTLGELLNSVAGTTILGANNNLGTNQTPGIRGASAGNVLLLIDGIPAYDPSVITNYFDLNFIDLQQVERIEILKGGQSTLYGSDAVAGVINIIMKKAGAGPFHINGNFSGGSYNELKQNLAINGRMKSVDYSVGYSHVAADGFSAATDKNNAGNFDKDGYNQHVVNGRLGIAVCEKIKMTAFGSYSRYKTELDAAGFTDDRDYRVYNNNVQGGLGANYHHAKGALQMNYSYNRSMRDYRDDSSHVSSIYSIYSRAKYVGRTHFVEAYNNWKWEQLELLVGADYRFNNTEQSYFSTGAFGPYTQPKLDAKMRQLSGYASMVYRMKSLVLELGGRWNHHSEYGDNFSFTFNPSYRVRKLKLFANLYSAFKTPTLYQLFDVSAGNIDLNPEKSIVAETGFSVEAITSLKIRVVGFYRKAKDAIIYTFDPNTYASRYENVSEQLNYGGELEMSYVKGKISANLNYTYTDGKTTSAYDGTGTPLGKDTTYFNLYRIPKHALNLELGAQVCPAFFTSVRAHVVSKREEFVYGSAPEELKGYALVDLYGEYKFDAKVKLYLDLKNVLNKKYVDFMGYNTKKFNFTIGVGFQL